MKRFIVVVGVLAALAGCSGVGQLARCTFDCAFPAPVPEVPDAGVPEAAAPCVGVKKAPLAK